MALVALFFSFVSFELLLEYSSLYIYGIEILSKYINANFTLCSCYTDYTASLSGRCIGTGIVFVYAITLCHDNDIRVVSGSLGVVSRLWCIIILGLYAADERSAADGDSSVRVFLRACI